MNLRRAVGSAVEGTDRELDEQRRVLTGLLRYRYVAMAALAVAIGLLPDFGRHRGWLAGLVLVVGLGSTELARHHVQRSARLPRWMAVLDVATAAAFLVVCPEAYPVVISVLVVMTGTWVFWYGARFTRWLLAGTAVVLLAIGATTEPAWWVASFLTWLLMGGFAIIVFSRVAAAMEASRQGYDDLVNGIHAGVWEAQGADGPVTFVNDHALTMLGYTREQFFDGEFMQSHVLADDLGVLAASRAQLAAGEDTEVSFRVIDGRGRVRLIGERIKLTRDADGRVTGRRSVVVDDTARWEAEASVRRYRDFIEGIPIALVILRLEDPDDTHSLRVVAANPAASRLVGVALDRVGARLVDIIPSEASFLTQVADVARLAEPLEHPFVQLHGVDGVHALRAVPLPDRCIGVSLEDVTKRARLAESFRHQALHDPLTGLPNRAMLNGELTRALQEADEAAGDDATVALLIIDLDQFKEVNDALGHEYGDRLLMVLARRMAARLRDCDTIARLGGDEFAVLVRGGGEAGAREVAARVLELIDQPLHVDDYRFQVAASIGIAVAPDHTRRADELLRHADAAMYRAKGSGGGVAVWTPGQDGSGMRRLELLADLRGAVASEAFTVHYQPRVDLTTLQTLGVEALVRWDHPRHGLLPPSDFIELAEVSGTIRLLTRQVTERAVRDVVSLATPVPLATSVNLSVRNLYDPHLVEWTAGLLAELEVPAGTLCFEITESQLMDDPSQAMEVLHQLREFGVRFSVDDFGTGYSSLAYLRELPIDEVKIDRVFVADLEHDDARIVRSVIDLGHNLDLHVVAEGVETAPVLERLRRLGCDSAQGFFLARPMPIEDLRSFVDAPGGAEGGLDDEREDGARADDDRPAGRPGTGSDGSPPPWEPQVTGR